VEYTSLLVVRRGKRLMGTLSEDLTKIVKKAGKNRFFGGRVKKNGEKPLRNMVFGREMGA